MTNPQQSYIQNEIEQFNKDINVLQDKLKKKKKKKKKKKQKKKKKKKQKKKRTKKKKKKKKKIHKEKKQTEGKINLLHGRVDQFKKQQSLSILII